MLRIPYPSPSKHKRKPLPRYNQIININFIHWTFAMRMNLINMCEHT